MALQVPPEGEMATAPFEIAGRRVPPGTRRDVVLPIARLPTQHQLEMSVAVLHGTAPGARIWLSAALHGDEINGIEIIARVLDQLDPTRLRGTVLAVPIVNVFGFTDQSRYLPDRRDLNRAFPGSPRGSLAGQLAALFMREIVGRCTHGIDLHTASHHRDNWPQVRANLDDPPTRALAQAFGAPVILHAATRDGSLRQAAAQRGVPTLLYEGGEAQRFNDRAIEAGVAGVRRTLAALDMADGTGAARPDAPVECRSSQWVRARRSGIARMEIALGQRVRRGARLGTIGGAFGERATTVRAPADGIVIGLIRNPLVYRGDALLHLAHPGT